MKQMIVFLALTLLGIAVFGLIMGTSDNSVRGAMGNVFSEQVQSQQEIYP